jgi:Tfp pilus assembly protein PilN
MIQFNLLPDVKIKYIKARRQKRLVMLVSFITTAGSMTVLVLMLLYVYAVQGAQISSLDSKINKSNSSIRDKKSQVDDINKVLTVQNQLISLDKLHADKPVLSRLYDYLSKVTPSQVTLSSVNLDNGEGVNTLNLQGSTDSLETINRFVDTLKFTTFTPKDSPDDKKTVFKEVVLTSFSRDKGGASYSVAMKYDPIIFSSAEQATSLAVPKGFITTRSELGRPVIQTQSEAENNAPAPKEGN